MTPIPSDVAAAIVAANHNIEAEPMPPSIVGLARWTWSVTGGTVAPIWRVGIGVLPRGTHGTGRDASPRTATLCALKNLTAAYTHAEQAARDEGKRRRNEHTKAACALDAASYAKRAAETIALAERVAAMWPEVAP